MLLSGKSGRPPRGRPDTPGCSRPRTASHSLNVAACAGRHHPSTLLSPSYATRRPSRYAAGALLLVIHLVVLDLLLTLKSTRDLPGEGMVTLFLRALPRKPASNSESSARRERHPPPKVVRAPVPDAVAIATPALDAAQRVHDIDAPVVAAAPGVAASGSLAAAPGAAGAAVAPLNLAIPKEFFSKPPPLTPAQEAMMDPRSNRLVLTRQEQIEVDFGQIECIAWVREPDGTIYRGPGHLQRVQDVGTNPFTFHARGREDRHEECVK
jgi:hypothetical protein